MGTIAYTALKRIISGHVVDTLYTNEFSLLKSNFVGNTFSSEHVSLNGKREVVASAREDDEISLTIQALTLADIPLWIEFFYSVKDGETFLFDEFGTIASPVNPVTYVMISKKFPPAREGTTEDFTLSFRIRVDI